MLNSVCCLWGNTHPSVRWQVLLGVGLLLGAGCLGLPGCSTEPSWSEPVVENDPLPWSGLRFELAVVGDPQLASAIEDLRGEWYARTEAKYSVRRMGLHELQSAGAPVEPGG